MPFAACAHLESMAPGFHTTLRIDGAGGSPNFVRAGDMRRSRICLFFSDKLLARDAFSQFRSHSYDYSDFVTSNKDLNLEALR